MIGNIMTSADPRSTKEGALRRQKTLLSKTPSAIKNDLDIVL